MRITDRQLQILEALARFKHLTAKQIAMLFKVKSSSNVSALLRELRTPKKPLVEKRGFWVVPIHWKLPDIHFLTKYWKDFVRDRLWYREESIKFIKNKNSVFRQDYFHRLSCADFNMYFQQWLVNSNYQFLFFNYYFDRKWSNRNKTWETLNSIQVKDFRIVPDGIGLFMTPERAYLFLFELHNGKDKKRAINQISAHCMGISQGSAEDKYNIKNAARVYYVFEHESCKRDVMNELDNNPNFYNFREYFLFKSIESMKSNFFVGWQYFNWNITNFIGHYSRKHNMKAILNDPLIQRDKYLMHIYKTTPKKQKRR
jgi:hypothetical protein